MQATAGTAAIVPTDTALARKLRIGKFVAASQAAIDSSARGAALDCHASARVEVRPAAPQREGDRGQRGGPRDARA